MQHFLFLLRRPPLTGADLRETLDMAMTFAAFDVAVSLLLLDDAVYCLKPGQNPPNPSLKSAAPLFAALALYDVREVWVEQESLQERGLGGMEWPIPVRLLRRCDVAALLAQADGVVSG